MYPGFFQYRYTLSTGMRLLVIFIICGVNANLPPAHANQPHHSDLDCRDRSQGEGCSTALPSFNSLPRPTLLCGQTQPPLSQRIASGSTIPRRTNEIPTTWHEDDISMETSLAECEAGPSGISQPKTGCKRKRLDNDNGSFSCEVCRKEYKTRSQLHQHEVVHSNVRPYVCDKCDASFKRKTDANRHSSIAHSNDRPFACKICGNSFKRNSDLKTHQNVHTDDRRCYICEICGKSFKRKAHLNEHIAFHSNSRSHSCELCSHVFESKSALKKHTKNIHSVEELNSREDSSEILQSVSKQERIEELHGRDIFQRMVPSGSIRNIRLDSVHGPVDRTNRHDQNHSKRRNEISVQATDSAGLNQGSDSYQMVRFPLGTREVYSNLDQTDYSERVDWPTGRFDVSNLEEAANEILQNQGDFAGWLRLRLEDTEGNSCRQSSSTNEQAY